MVSEEFDPKVFVTPSTPNDSQIAVISYYDIGFTCERH